MKSLFCGLKNIGLKNIGLKNIGLKNIGLKNIAQLMLLIGLTSLGTPALAQTSEPNYREQRFQTVLETYKADLKAAQQAGDRATEISTLQEAGQAHQYFGDFQAAQDLLEQGLNLARDTGDLAQEESLLSDLAIVASKFGDYRGIHFLQQQLAWARQQGRSDSENIALQNLGGAYFTAGNIQKMLEVYDEYLPRVQAKGDFWELHGAFQNLSSAYDRMGDLEQALDFRKQALKLAVDEGNLELGLAGMYEVGELYERLDQSEDALGWYYQVFSIANRIGNTYWTEQALESTGWNYGKLGDLEKGIDVLRQAFELTQIDGSVDPFGALDRLSLLYARQGDYENALDFQERCTTYDLAMGGEDIGGCGPQELAYIQLLAGQPAAAERVLRRELVRAEEGLTDPKSINLQVISADEQNLGDRDLSALTYRLLIAALVEQNKPLDALVVSEEGRAQAFIDLLRTRSAVKTPPPSLDRIRQIAKSQNTTLVQYSLLYKEEPWPAGVYAYRQPAPTQVTDLLIWVIPPSGDITFRRVKLDELAETTPTYLAGLVRDSRGAIGSDKTNFTNNPASGSESTPQPVTPTVRRRPPFRDLYNLLIDPIAELLPTDPEATITFIPQGPLFLVPFAALLDQEGHFLVEKHTIVTAPSIQVLDLIENRLDNRQPRSSTSSASTALVVGNPTMPKIRSKLGEPPPPLAELPGAEAEAQAIATLLNTQVLLGSEATEATVRQRLPQSQIIHFATHGILDNFLGLEAAVAFAPDADDDGFLTAREVSELQLRADLVVLSACNTGRGEITGDGVIGLSRSFLGAGADSVVASLWSVPDEPTALLMTTFYQQLEQQAGSQNLAHVNRAKALRQAMLQTKAQFSDPRDWAAFLLIGAAGK
jgi:CHAT domain-containing protein/tetratricopeptide (TPR) repeat protein